MNLEELRPKLKQVARRYAERPDEIEDLTQMALIKCWTMLEENPDTPISYLIVASKNIMSNERKASHRQKRRPKQGFISLSDTLPGTEMTIEETLGTETPNYFPDEVANDTYSVLRSQFGKNFVHRLSQQGNYRKIRRAILRHVIEEVEQLTPQDIPEVVSKEFFKGKKLANFIHVFYRGSIVAAMNDLYPNTYVPWNFSNVPRGFWEGRIGQHNGRSAVRWLLQQKGFTTVREAGTLRTKDFIEYKLSGMLTQVFSNSPKLAVKSIFPEIKPWEFHKSVKGYFDDEKNQKEAIASYLIDRVGTTIAELTPEETYDLGLRRSVSARDMKTNGLTELVCNFNTSSYRLFTHHFPEQILPWTLYGSSLAWKDNPRATGEQAMRWLIETYLDLPRNELPIYLSQELLKRVGFGGIITNRSIGFNGRTYEIANALYPGEYTPWDFRRARKGIIVPEVGNFQRSKSS